MRGVEGMWSPATVSPGQKQIIDYAGRNDGLVSGAFTTTKLDPTIGNSLSISGGSGYDKGIIPNHALDWYRAGTITYSFWLKSAGSDMLPYNETNGNARFGFYMSGTTFRVFSGNSSRTHDLATYISGYAATDMHHYAVVMTRDAGSMVTLNYSIFVDGRFVLSNSFIATTNVTGAFSNVIIGYASVIAGGHFLFHNRGLSADEIWQLYDPATRWSYYPWVGTKRWFVMGGSVSPIFGRRTLNSLNRVGSRSLVWTY